MLLVQLLSLLPTGACRHVGGGAAGRDAGGRAGEWTALAEPGERGHLAPLGPQADSAQEAAAAEAGTGGGAAAAEAAPTCPASSPGPPHAPPQPARGGAERAATSGRTERWTLRVRGAARTPGVSQGDSRNRLALPRASFPLSRRDCRLRSLGTWKWKRFFVRRRLSVVPRPLLLRTQHGKFSNYSNIEYMHRWTPCLGIGNLEAIFYNLEITHGMKWD